jgi:hypothetical protein
MAKKLKQNTLNNTGKQNIRRNSIISTALILPYLFNNQLLKGVPFRGNITDVLLASSLYFSANILASNLQGKISNKASKYLAAAATLVLASGAELTQKYHLTPGTYDPKDFAAYAIGVGASLGLDLAIDSIMQKIKANQKKLKQKTTLDSVV